MKITLMINRQKIGDTIKETFSVNPEHSYCFSNKRNIFYKLWKTRTTRSIHQDYKLLSIEDEKRKIVYTYEYNKTAKIPKLSENIVIDYNPVLGKKTCYKCIHKRFANGKHLCAMRGKEIKPKKSCYKCLWWNELEG